MGVKSETRDPKIPRSQYLKILGKKKAVFALVCTNFLVAAGFSGDSAIGQEPGSLLAAAP